MDSKSSFNLHSSIINRHPTACYMITGSLFVVTVLLVILQIYAVSENSFVTDLPSYSIVVDCGSTGTRINIYEWLSRNVKKDELKLLRSFPDFSTGNHLLRHSCEYHCMQSEPGLDKFTYNFSALSSALEPLLIWAEKNIPPDKHMHTPIFVLGTAGLRKLPTEESNWIMKNVMNVVKKHQFIYKQSWIKVLSGEEEAYYAWVALNYKLGRLDKFSKNTTVGILDLGGSSMQVAFEMKKSIKYQHYFKSQIGSVEHGLLTYSLAGFGLNDAFDRSVNLVSKDSLAKRWRDGGYELRHPCLNKGFMRNYTCLTCSKEWKNTKEQNITNNLIIGRPPLLVGYPSWIKCKALAKAVIASMNSSDVIQLSKSSNCNYFGSIYEGITNGSKFTFKHCSQITHFHALSGFSFIYSTATNDSKTNLTKMLEIGEQSCSRSWADVERGYEKQKYAEQSCFRIPYIISLVKDVMCLTDANISFGPGDISWTLGAAIIEGKLLQFTRKEGPIEQLIQRNMSTFFSLLFAMVLCICATIFRKRFKRVIMRFILPRRSTFCELPLTTFFSPKDG